MKYSSKLVYKYINGEDIDEYTIDELENDVSFMIEVLKLSKDKKMYELCSYNVKKDFEFINFLIEYFKNDQDFIIKISKEFIFDEKNNDEERIELMIKLNKLIKDKEKKFEINVLLSSYYELDRVTIESIKNNIKSDRILLNDIGKGFFIIQDKYNNNEYILNYYAKRFIYDLFENDINLKEYLHIKYNSFEKLESFGINKFFIMLIGTYDKFLGDYIGNHIEILDEIKKDLNRIKSDWDSFIKRNNENRWNLLLERLKSYIEMNQNDISFIFETFYLNCTNYDYNKKFFDKMPREIYHYLISKNIDMNKLDFINIGHLYKIKEIILSTLNMDIVDNEYCDIDFYDKFNKKTNNKAKILSFPNINKNKD